MTSGSTDGAPRTRQARLAGPSSVVDRRVNPARPDLAAIDLAGIVAASRYAEPVAAHATATMAMLRAAPDDDAVAVSALLLGEGFDVFDMAGGWAWGQCRHDAYVGWVRTGALAFTPAPPGKRITAPTASVFAHPDIKARVTATLPLNAVVSGEAAGAFVATPLGFIHSRHLGTSPTDPVAVALGFVGTPYVWGGRARDGIDCSGLTQAALIACGVACPRDSDQQRDAFAPVADADRRRGDLVVFPGHVGLLIDADFVIHANAFAMATTVEPLAEIAARLAPTGFRRPV